ncbi:hypothetical protein KJ657_00295 [Patescibacteria group bacterium]|nr:hypothetical protein [Patescibacteria group bacterium]MBU1015517.1 hypothetical protein [Patescibacteria group bacterium]MBU1685635.1 hypothetical protein [Patescibacteria group bacterium]MBU1938128.1 hypothetical protein [Patescibacteria group bacterium]
MNKIGKITTLTTAIVGLGACAPALESARQADQQQEAVNDTRANLQMALAKWNTDKTGVQAGENPNAIYSIGCRKFISEDVGREFAIIEARSFFYQFACPNEKGTGHYFMPLMQAGTSIVGDVMCVRLYGPKKVVCDGKLVELEVPK